MSGPEKQHESKENESTKPEAVLTLSIGKARELFKKQVKLLTSQLRLLIGAEIGHPRPITPTQKTDATEGKVIDPELAKMEEKQDLQEYTEFKIFYIVLKYYHISDLF